jgi:hypothetical protein
MSLVFPDDAQRETQHPPFFWPLGEVAYGHGEVYLTGLYPMWRNPISS